MAPLPAPEGLKTAGLALWTAIADPVDGWDLRPDELVVLERACRVRDRCAVLDARLDDMLEDPTEDFTSRGSMGQEVEAPILGSLAKLDALLQRLLTSLKLPDLGATAGDESPASTAARKAAQVRWSKPRGA